MTKYKAVKTTLNGIKFDSKAESQRYAKLTALEKAGKITRLTLQPTYVLAPSVKFAGAARAKPALRYKADFFYVENGFHVVEDVKGMQTPAFKIKRHLMMSVHGIDVRLTK
jgi:hypothetical protein